MAWSQLIGLISFELFGHLHNVITDFSAHFDFQIGQSVRNSASATRRAAPDRSGLASRPCCPVKSTNLDRWSNRSDGSSTGCRPHPEHPAIRRDRGGDAPGRRLPHRAGTFRRGARQRPEDRPDHGVPASDLLAEHGRADVVHRADGEAQFRLCGTTPSRPMSTIITWSAGSADAVRRCRPPRWRRGPNGWPARRATPTSAIPSRCSGCVRSIRPAQPASQPARTAPDQTAASRYSSVEQHMMVKLGGNFGQA